MTVEEFRASEKQHWHGALLALWHDGQGDWEEAHTFAQETEGREGAWVHAYLHRREGDTANAAYWYRRAARPMATGDYAAEWTAMVKELLDGREGSGPTLGG